MTTEKEIDKQLQREVLAYNNKPYEGELPEDFIDRFESALMFVPPSDHKYNMAYTMELLKKSVTDLTIMDVGLIINLIYKCPWFQIYETAKQAIEATMQLDKIRDEYNEKNAEFEKEIMKRKTRLMQMSGVVPLKKVKIAQA